jgi:aspartate/methionine/tyrosine aminotransferase
VIDPDDLDAAITGATKVVVVNNPSNPTGTVFPPGVVRDLLLLARKRDIYLVSDEIYEDFVFDGEFASAGAEGDPRVVVVSGVSKSYAMTGWRLGYAVADPSLVSLMAKLLEPIVSNASSVSQRAAEAALRGSQEDIARMRSAYKRRRDIVRDLLEPAGLLPVIPSGAFYALVDVSSFGISGREVALQLLRDEHVATAPGEAFGSVSSGLVRISLATDDDQLAEACRRIVRFARRRSPTSEVVGH